MIKTLDYQDKAVKEIVEKTMILLKDQGMRKKIVFRAPTGAGKTVMASEALDMLTSDLAGEGSEIAFIWIAPNKLHQQSYMKMKNYFTEKRSLQPVMYDELDHSNSSYIKQGEVLFVNWESINKDNNVMVRDTEKSSSLFDITRRTQEDYGIPIIVVIDEEHMFGGRQATQSEKVLKAINPKVEFRISATPITASPDAYVSVSRGDVIKEEMIKDGISINPLVKDSGSGLSSNDYLLDEAFSKRKEIKNAYNKLNVNINPLLLIQLPNDNSETLNEEEKSIMEMVRERLKNNYDITTQNGKLAIWLSGVKENVDCLENDTNLTEVLLFKQAIALGWDCPRAAVLLIFRDIKSTTFGVQTVGRIMRMPEQKYYPEAILNHGFVYTNLSREKIEIVADDMNYISKSLVAYRSEGLINVKLLSSYSERLGAERNRLGPDFYQYLVNTFNNKWLNQPVQSDFISPFADGVSVNIPDNSFLINETDNKEKATKIAKINFNVQAIQTQIINNIEISGDADAIDISKNHIIKYARNPDELSKELTKFCAECLDSRFEKVSVVTLRGYLLQYMEDYFGVIEDEAPKVILYDSNSIKFKFVLNLVITNYLKVISARRTAAKKRSFKEYKWEVPEWREYNETLNHAEPKVEKHALHPFVQLNEVSNPEKRFETFLETYKNDIDWWYKNGDEGKQHFAIKYIGKNSSNALFYVDFVIRMKNGQIFLFDTKTMQSDPDAPNKHNALIKYFSDNTQLNLKGGVLIEDKGVWKYSQEKITNTNDLSDWNAYFPDNFQ